MSDLKTELRRDFDEYEHLLGNWRMASELFPDGHQIFSAELRTVPMTSRPAGSDKY